MFAHSGVFLLRTSNARPYKTQKRHCRSNAVLVAECISDSPLNLVGTEASGTSIHMARSTVDNRLDALNIGLPGTVGASVGVGNLDTEGYALVAEFALSHPLHLLAVTNFNACIHKHLI